MDGKSLEDTLIFQDYITDIMYKTGIPINCYSSRKYNIEKGESIGRVEIKQDKKAKETGNIYIEVAERQKSNTSSYVDSGIFRKDNTLFVLIGDYDEMWLFSKKQLQNIVKHNKEFKIVQTETSIGVLIPLSYLDKHPSVILVKWINGKEV